MKKQFANNQHRQVLFNDEKIFTTEAAANHQNDRIWTTGISAIPDNLRCATRAQNPASVTVWGGFYR